MNANELADLIGMCGDGGYNQDAAKMLRQQQAEIEALKSRIHDAMAWLDLKEWNSIDIEILLEIFEGKAQEK